MIDAFVLSGWVGGSQSSYQVESHLSAFFYLAHLALTAAEILARPSGVRLRFFLLEGFSSLAGFSNVATALGLPGLRLAAVPSASNERTCFSFTISAPSAANASDSPISSPLGLYYPDIMR
jgi:hypothetical protein